MNLSQEKIIILDWVLGMFALSFLLSLALESVFPGLINNYFNINVLLVLSLILLMLRVFKK